VTGSGQDGAYSVFQRRWWLDAAAPGCWDEVQVRRGDGVVARLPFVLARRAGLTRLGTAPFTKTLGPWLAPSDAKYTNALATEIELTGELIERLPRHDVFRQAFAPELTNWLAFHWAGFRASAAVTYRIDVLDDLDAVWSSMRENIRREIRKAERQVEIVDDLGLGRLVDLAGRTFARQGLAGGVDTAALERIDAACADRDSRTTLFAVDAQRRVHAAAYFVWDEHVTYYLLGGGDPELRNSGASSLLLWRGIQHAAGVSRSFDFEGSMLEPVERFFRAFGGRQTPYLVLARRGRLAGALAAAAGVARSLRR